MAVLKLKGEEFNTFPEILKNYAMYMTTITGKSDKTVCEYLLDLRTFFRFMIMSRDGSELSKEEFEDISIKHIALDDVAAVTASDIMSFLFYVKSDRDNNTSSRSRKLSALRSFFKYMHSKKHLIDSNPTADIDTPKPAKTLPKFLKLDESVKLLETVLNDYESKTRVRDYAIVTLFLNTGMRLSELVGLNLTSFDRDLSSVNVLGKGNKERKIYLNDSAKEALKSYLTLRLDPKHIKTESKAVFLSGRQTRISPKTVQWMVNKYLDMAGFASRNLSVHKLRHTAATLMFQSGEVDIRVIKEVLGHEQLNTTQIYTHVVDKNMQDAMKKNPLANLKIKKIPPKPKSDSGDTEDE